ncbi:hypothetical protein D3C78_1564740 [compost metagenome]
MADQGCGDQVLNGLALEQFVQLRLRHCIEFFHQLLEGAVAHGRALQALGRVQLDGAVPVPRLAHQPCLFAEAGDTQLQRIAEAINAQLTRLHKGLSRLLQNVPATGSIELARRLADRK